MRDKFIVKLCNRLLKLTSNEYQSNLSAVIWLGVTELERRKGAEK